MVFNWKRAYRSGTVSHPRQQSLSSVCALARQALVRHRKRKSSFQRTGTAAHFTNTSVRSQLIAY